MSNPWTQIKLFRTGYWYVAETVFLPLTRPRGNRRAPPPSNLSVCSIWPALPPGSTERRTELEERLTPGTTRAMGLAPCIPDKKIFYLIACQIFLGIKKFGQIHCKLFGKWVWNTDILYFHFENWFLITTFKDIGMIHRNFAGREKKSCLLLRCKIIQYVINKIGHFVYFRIESMAESFTYINLKKKWTQQNVTCTMLYLKKNWFMARCI